MSSLLLGRSFDLLVHPVDDVSFVPDDKALTQLDSLGENPIIHAGIDEGLAHASYLNYQGQEEEVGDECREMTLVGLYRIDQHKT